jgi:tetratricopeptide (TPR) repeat protein
MSTSARGAARTTSTEPKAEMPIAADPTTRQTFAEAVEQERLGQLNLAEQTYRRIVERAPGHVESLHNLGSILRRFGRMGEAEELFRKVLELRPDSCMTIHQLTHSCRYDSTDHGDVKQIKKLLRGSGLSDRDAIFLRFSLGKIYNDCREFESAFNCYRRGNALLHKRSRFDSRTLAEYVDLVIDTFTPELIDGLHPFSSPTEVPVYIIGMPRSGTTLLEQILCAHPLVQGGGELTLVDQAIQNLRTRGNLKEHYPVFASQLKGEVLASEAKNYETFVQTLVDGDAVRLIDKMPYNFKYIGLIMLLFSQARIVHCRRDPRDVCLSNYFQLYVTKHEHTYSLSDLGHYYRQYERLMAHWRSIADPSRLYEINYEDLVTDTQAKAPEMIGFLGLEWDDRCLRPHESDRAVQTASTWQVRQPIYSSSVSRWKNYEKFLGPLEKALAGD